MNYLTNEYITQSTNSIIHSVFCPLSSVFCCSTTVKNPLQISSFMRNKPNFQKSQVNVSIFSQKAYENKSNWTLGENKPNSNPIKPNTKPISLLPKSPILTTLPPKINLKKSRFSPKSRYFQSYLRYVIA